MKKGINLFLLFVIVGAALLFFILDPNKNEIFPRCLFHSITGGYCPGCGSQRALHSMLHFDFRAAARSNLLFLPAGLLILYHYIHPLLNHVFKWKLPNIFYLRNTPWVILAVVLVFWIARNLPWYPFYLLAPS